MKIIEEPIKRTDLLSLSDIVFDDEMVKAVVDVCHNRIAIDSELHSDLEEGLLQDGSSQDDLWGINLYPDDDDFIEYDSMINIRPRQNNRSRDVEDSDIRKQIESVVKRWIL